MDDVRGDFLGIEMRMRGISQGRFQCVRNIWQ